MLALDHTASMENTMDADRRRKALVDVINEKDWTAAELIRRSGVSPNTVYGFLKGRTNSITIPNLKKLADAAGVPLSRLTGEKELPHIETNVLWLRGDVQAGVWREATEWAENDWEAVPIPVQNEYKSYAFGLRVNGPSMNAVYPQGSIVVCVPIEELPRTLRSGDHVIVQRVRDDLYEMTIKELIVDGNGHPWLWPRSTDPRHQSPIEIPSTDPDELAEVQIRVVALVIGAYQARPV